MICNTENLPFRMIAEVCCIYGTLTYVEGCCTSGGMLHLQRVVARMVGCFIYGRMLSLWRDVAFVRRIMQI